MSKAAKALVPSPRHRSWGRSVLAAAAAAALLAGCGKTGATPSTHTSAAAASAAATSTAAATGGHGCGAVTHVAYHDESGVLSSLGSRYTSQFNGYAAPIFKSAWAHARPAGKAPYTVGAIVTQPISATQAALVPQLQKQLHAIKGVGKVDLLTSSPTGLTQQLQQAHELIQQHVDFLVVQPLVPQAFVQIAAAAKAAGIPFISIFNATPSADSINIAPNSVGDTLRSGAQLARALGGKGTVVGVHGVPATGVDQESFKGWHAAFAACPGIHFDDSVIGEFQPSVAKSAMLSFLSSHPQPIAGVVETAGMTSGIIQAFQQAGRPLPKFVDAGPSDGELAFFKRNPSKLVSAFSITPSGVSQATAYTISQLIAGHGPKVSELASMSTVIDASNLSQFLPAAAAVGDPTVVEGPWDQTSYLAPMFDK